MHQHNFLLSDLLMSSKSRFKFNYYQKLFFLCLSLTIFFDIHLKIRQVNLLGNYSRKICEHIKIIGVFIIDYILIFNEINEAT